MSPPTTTAILDPSTMKPKKTEYWIREGHLWKRVHIQVRTTLYVPEQSDDGPDINKLTGMRITMVTRTEQGRGYRD